MSYTPCEWAPLQNVLHNILLDNREGMSEFELFDVLKSPPYTLFAEEALREPLSLFQSHFIVFNALYHLRDTWLQNKTGTLDIHCTNIRHEPWEAGKNAIVEQDKLRAYYLDWSNLNDTDQSQVEALLDNFWGAFASIDHQDQYHAMSLQQALDLLKLSTPFSSQHLKQQYRKMLHQYHPDKGGNNSYTASLHDAYQRLKTHGQTK